ETGTPGGRLGELCDARRVLAEPGRLEIGERSHRPEGSGDPVAADPSLGQRLALERLLPHPRVVEVAEQVCEVLDGQPGEPRVVRRTLTALDHVAGRVGTGGRQE